MCGRAAHTGEVIYMSKATVPSASADDANGAASADGADDGDLTYDELHDLFMQSLTLIAEAAEATGEEADAMAEAARSAKQQSPDEALRNLANAARNKSG